MLGLGISFTLIPFICKAYFHNFDVYFIHLFICNDININSFYLPFQQISYKLLDHHCRKELPNLPILKIYELLARHDPQSGKRSFFYSHHCNVWFFMNR